MTEFSHTQI